MNSLRSYLKIREQAVFVLLLFFSLTAGAQTPGIVLKGSIRNMPFEEFVNMAEKSTPARFYFNSDSVKTLKVNISGDSIRLETILQQVLSARNLRFYIDRYANVIIYGGKKPVVEKLPGYRQDNAGEVTITRSEETGLTDAEKKYLEGKTEEEIETCVVGKKGSAGKDHNCIIRGRISVKETGEPLIGATIYIQETGGGAATDQDGFFRLIMKPGKYTARANCLSMKEKTFFLDLLSDGNLTIQMEKTVISLNEVTVTSKRHDNVQGIQMGFEHISTDKMKEIPVVMGERDLLKVAQLLPGVQTAGEGSAGLIVRGGSADENLFYLNKIPVYNTSHLFGFFTAFNPDVVSDFTLYKSNIPAAYGSRISSVFDISTRQGNRKKFYGQGGISPVTGHFELEGPIIKDKSSFVVSARSTYSDWLLSKMNDIDLKNSHARFYDATAAINTEINQANLVKLFGYTSSDRFTLSSSDDYSYSNLGASAYWKHLFSSTLTSDFSAVFSHYGFHHVDKGNVSEAYSHKYELKHYEIKSDFNYLTPGGHQLQFGINAIRYQLDRGNIIPHGEESTRIPVFLGKEKGMEGALYFSDEFSLFNRLTLQTGLRYSAFAYLGPADVLEYYPGVPMNMKNITDTLVFASNRIVKQYSGPEVRVAANYHLGKNHSLKASYNRIRQYIFMLSNTLAISPDDQWKLSDYHIKPPVSDQISFGYYHDLPSGGYSASLEVYRKWIRQITEYRDGATFISNEKPEMVLLQGRQDAYGLEFMFKKNSGKITGWLSYAYSNSSVLVDSPIAQNRINSGKRYPSNYDRPHSLNLVTNLRYSRRLSSAFNVVYSTGRPITYPVSVYKYEDKYLLCYSGRNQYRLPDYFRIDVSLNAEGNLLSRKLIHSSWMLNVYNAAGFKNAYSVFFETDNGLVKGYKLSVFARPVITLSWNFKFGNYANE